MIFVVSNGASYSDHVLYFIRAPDESTMKAAMRRADARNSCYRYKIVAYAADTSLHMRTDSTRYSLIELNDWEQGWPLEAWEREWMDEELLAWADSDGSGKHPFPRQGE